MYCTCICKQQFLCPQSVGTQFVSGCGQIFRKQVIHKAMWECVYFRDNKNMFAREYSRMHTQNKKRKHWNSFDTNNPYTKQCY